jgi:hypothetical protein
MPCAKTDLQRVRNGKGHHLTLSRQAERLNSLGPTRAWCTKSRVPDSSILKERRALETCQTRPSLDDFCENSAPKLERPWETLHDC